ncbi:MAG: hypothetical protein H0U71_01765 [Gammaproteobacteria bacterium]|nr:hypothetical protein [Gammaproteobacteria bacterium]
MKIWFIFFVVLGFSFSVHALDGALKKKYALLLLTDDYGILKEADLARYQKKMKYEKFSAKHDGLVYWQCFPRDKIEITLKDMGYTAEEFDKTDTISDILLTAYKEPGVKHIYVMRRAYPISAYHEVFLRWEKLMKGEKYVCLAGEFISHDEKINDGVKIEENYWTYDKIKTKKGSNSYFVEH